MKQTELKLEYWPLEKLKRYDKNAKIHTKEQVGRLAQSIKRHGIANPLNVKPDGEIITGHGRSMALEQLKAKVAPVFVRHDLTEREIKELRLADNKTASVDYDNELLKIDFEDLLSENDDLNDLAAGTGFELRDIEMLTEDLGDLDLNLAGSQDQSDFDNQVEQSAGDTETEITAIDEKQVPISKVIGFKSVSVADGRDIKRFMAVLCDQMNEEEPSRAFAKFIDQTLSE